jgi:hypothetical protein
MFFFEKKNQKNFASLRAPVEMSATATKSFLLLFFKKEGLPSFPRRMRPNRRGAIA